MRWRWPEVGWLAERLIRAGMTAVGWICAAFGLPDVPGAAITAVSRGAMGRIWRLGLGAAHASATCASPFRAVHDGHDQAQ
jgi:hypothetical protein